MSDILYLNGEPIGRIVSFDIESRSLKPLDPPSIALGTRTFSGEFRTTFTDTAALQRLFAAPVKPRRRGWRYARWLLLATVLLTLSSGAL